ncbi:MAG: hypothetical protein AAGC60_21015 [Acidobacteriota bacterium]
MRPRGTALGALVALLLVASIACAGEASKSSSAASTGGAGDDSQLVDRSHFVIEGDEAARATPRVSVHVDAGTGQGLFDDGIRRYEIRMLPEALDDDTLTVWITGLREDFEPGTIEVTDSLKTPSVLVGVGRGLLKGYKEVLSGHLELAEIDGEISLTFDVELESQSALDRARRGQRVRVHGRVVDAAIPD